MIKILLENGYDHTKKWFSCCIMKLLDKLTGGWVALVENRHTYM